VIAAATDGASVTRRLPPTRRLGLAGAEGEQILVERSDESRRSRTVIGQHVIAEPPDDRHGYPRELAPDQFGGRGNFVGDGHHGHLQDPTVRVAQPGQVVQGGQSGGADRDVGETEPPRPAHGVGDDHADAAPGALVEPRAQSTGRGIGIDGQENDVPGRHVAGIDARGRQHQTVPGLDDPGGAVRGLLRCHDPDGLTVDRLVAGGGRHHPVLGLAHHLAGHDDDVAIAQSPAAVRPGERRKQAGDLLGQVRFVGDLAHAGQGDDLDGTGHARPWEGSSAARARHAAARSAAVDTSVIMAGTARQAMPRPATSSTRSASTRSTSQPSMNPPPDRAP
jgi:hypothetical protein